MEEEVEKLMQEHMNSSELQEQQRKELGGLIKKDLKGFKEYQSNLYNHNVMRFFLSRRLKKGSIFGELGILMNKTRSATIVCFEDTHFATLDKVNYINILIEADQKRQTEKNKFFKDYLLNTI